jgi:hypothetical protein
MAVRYRIFPPIGVARLGEDPDFFLGPELPGSGPAEPQANGAAVPVVRFKDASRKKIRKQGARFHLFESDDGQNWRPANLPPAATVTWTVTLTNKKSAVKRGGLPPIKPERPQIPAATAGQVIDGGTRTITGQDAVSTPFTGTYKTVASSGSPFQVDVELGQLRTDAAGRLIVLGGKGFSSAPSGTPLSTFYINPNWHDDVADGPVTAEVHLAPGAGPIAAEGGAWVIVAPPDYAPAVGGVVTLHDIVRQVGIDHFGLTVPATPSFDLDIAPILSRVRRLRWLHDDATWSDPRLDSPKLRSRKPADKPLRKDVLEQIVLTVEKVFEGHVDPTGPEFRLRKFQRAFLDAWVKGDFDDAAAPAPTLSAAGLTRAALDGAVGQGFCPGIEAGIIMLDPTLYATPFDFRIDHAGVKSGDLTALMAQPWQADFFDCNTEWWPSQRPDLAPQPGGSTKPWVRGAASRKLLVERSARLGFVVQEGANEVLVEAERDPTLSPA